MKTTSVNRVNFGANNMIAPVLKKTINRSLLKNTTSTFKPLCGPKEVKEAKKWVAAYTAENALLGAATAQLGALGSAALTTIEIEMAIHILKGIYNFKLSDNAFKILGMGIAGSAIGTKTFDLASKSIFAFFPGIGNVANAIVSGSVTATIGGAVIGLAEQMDKARKRGEALDKFIKEMEKK